MKTKLQFLRCAMLLIFSVTTWGIWAQSSTTDPDHACLNSTEDYWVINTPGSTYNWVLSGGGTITTGQGTDKIKVNWTVIGPYTLTVTEKNSSNCYGTPVVLNIIVDPLPAVFNVTGGGSYCSGGTGLPVGLSDSELGVSYQLQLGSVNTGIPVVGTGDPINFGNKTIAGTYTVIATATSSTACSTNMAGNAVVVIDPLPTVFNVTGGGSYCIGGTGVALGLSDSELGVNYQLQLDNINNGTPVPGTGNAITFGNKTGAGTYTVIATNTSATACSINMTGSAIVTVNPLPIPTIGGLTTVPTLSSVVYTTEAGMTNYVWTVSSGGTITAGGTSTDNTITVKWNVAGPQSVSVNYSNANGCTALTATISGVTIGNLPIPTITGPTPVCINTIGNVYTTESGMTNYMWTVSTGGSVTAGGGTTNNTVTVTWNTAGPHTITVNYTDGDGYTAASPTSYSITVNNLPVPAISGPTPVCVGSTGNIYETETGMTGYIWVISTGGVITAGGTTTDNTVTITWSTEGPKTISVNYNNATGCTAVSPTIKSVTVNPLPTTSPIWHN